MTEPFRPATEDDVLDVVRWCVAEGKPLEIIGRQTKRDLGRPIQAEYTLEGSKLDGIISYEPEELVITAKPGTRLTDIEALLSAKGQQLAFEPPDLGPLLGAPPNEGTLGGAITCNLSGPRRMQAGAARDHLLGAKVVTGRGEKVKFGGKVVKNVTGYDVCKLLCGSFGTLAVMTEVHVKVLPAPETETTVLVRGLDEAAGTKALADALATPHDVSGAAHLPHDIARRSTVETVARAGGPVSCVRIEGVQTSVDYRVDCLQRELGVRAEMATLDTADSQKLWAEIRDVRAFADGSEHPVWKICVAPDRAADVVARIKARIPVQAYYDWAGGLIWLMAFSDDDAGTDAVRAELRGAGHATLIRASRTLRAAAPVFQPQPRALADLSARIKDSFDPQRILNPGRMYAGI